MKKSSIIRISAIAAITFLAACGGSETPQETTSNEAPASMVAPTVLTKEQKMEQGKAVYEKVCQACHQADGKGVPSAFPPLAESDYLAADLKKSIDGVVNGLNGEITVNGNKYNSAMPKADLSDEEIANVFTYVLNNFSNKGGEVSAEEVAATRK